MTRPIPLAPRTRLALLAGLSLLAAAACKETTGNAPPKVARVAVAPDSFSVIVAHQYQLIVTPLSSSGQAIDNKKPTFKTSDATIAQVNGTGVVVGVKPGNATITATVDGVSGEARVTVIREPVARLQIDPPGGQVLYVGQTFDLTGKPFDAANNLLSDRDVAWSSTNPGVATVAKTGQQTARVTAVAPGTTTINAQSEGTPASVQISVTFRAATVKITPTGAQVLRVGGSLQLTATPYDAQNNPVNGLTETWTSSFPQVATVDASTGKVTAIAPGNTTISVQVDQLTQSVPVTVTLVPLKAVRLSPSPSFDIFETTSKQLTVTLIDSTGAVTTQIGRAIAFQPSDNTVASINGAGVVTGLTPGSSDITVTAQTSGVNDIVSTVTTVNVKHINTAAVIIPNTVSLTVGNTVSITGQVQDSLGRPLANRLITWTSSDPTIFTVQSTGTVTALLTPLKAGSATLTASNETKSATAAVTVK